jgi:putative CocE/NonD family hydrolase
MFGKTWQTSESKYKVISQKGVMIPVSDGIKLEAHIFRPESREKFPAILGASPYGKVGQSEPIKPGAFSSISPLPGEEKPRGALEMGDPHFYAKRGYVHILVNVRGTGKSEGYFELLSEREVEDVNEVIEWVAKQSWCDGNVGMFGVSYFAMIQLATASSNASPHLKCIFSPWGLTDIYRDMIYHGGILAGGWVVHWAGRSLTYGNVRPRNEALERLGQEGYLKAAAELAKDPDIAAAKPLMDALRDPLKPANSLVVNILLNPLDNEFWRRRKPAYEKIKIPTYLGADWGNYALHLPAAFRSWDNITATKKMLLGPPVYLDRPLYQLSYESLRWFDHWLKGIDTGIDEEKPIKLFLMGTNGWKEADEWPLPETKWTSFYLHEGGLLSEKEHYPNEGSDSYFDSPWERGLLQYLTPTLVEDTEVIGPIVARIFASTNDAEILWSLRLFEEEENSHKQNILTAGWLRGSHRAIDEEKSKPWLPYHPHDFEEPLELGKIYQIKIGIIPTAKLFRAGSKIGLLISSSDHDPDTPLGVLGSTHIKRQSPSRITIYHDDDHPSQLILPITSGNVLGTFMSGGKFS